MTPCEEVRKGKFHRKRKIEKGKGVKKLLVTFVAEDFIYPV